MATGERVEILDLLLITPADEVAETELNPQLAGSLHYGVTQCNDSYQFWERYVMHGQFQSFVIRIRIELVEGDRAVLVGSAIEQRGKQPTTPDVT